MVEAVVSDRRIIELMIGAPPDLDAVSSLLIEVARDVILPRFRRLAPGDIERKRSIVDPDDLVTIVDRQAEERLTQELLALVPGSRAIGEEAAHADPAILGHLAGDGPLWLLDPIDGTRNFVAGDDGFGTMLAFVTGGEVRAAWILLPARDELYVAEEGRGAWLNGVPLRTLTGAPEAPLRGVLHTRYMPTGVREAIERRSAGCFASTRDARSAAVEYMEVLRAHRDFAVYHRLLPWDHAAPAHIVREGGGRVIHLDGRPYTPRSTDQVTIVAGSADVAGQLLSWFVDASQEARETP